MIVHHSNLETLEKTFDIDKKKLVCYHCGVACDLKGMVEERRDFLVGMDAIKDEPYVAPAILKKDIADNREKRNQFVGYKYRIEFSKIGPITFISHLDLQKVMARVFKRGGLNTLHSEGYNLRPLLSFGPALTLGISSLTEYFDVRVPSEWDDFGKMLEILNQHSEPGIIFKAITVIGSKTPSIQDSAKSFRYFVPVKNKELVENVVSKMNTDEQILIQSYSKKDEVFVEKDIRPMILRMETGMLDLSETILDIIDEVSPCRIPGVFITTQVKQGAGVRPSEILDVLKTRGLDVERPIKVAIELND
jgi:radical SAM-linked protein